MDRMLTAGDKLRLKLFRLYAANLAIHLPEVPSSVFVCPVCAFPFVETDVLHDSLKVDIGHVYPEQAGGNCFTLECRGCNGKLNRAGDNELVELHKQWEAMQPGSNAPPIIGAIRMPSGRVEIEVSARGIHAHFARAHPLAFQDALKALVEHTPVKITMPAVHKGKINLGMLHSAHLLMFRAFAYGYLFTPAGQYIRRIVDKSEHLDDSPFISVELPNDGKVRREMLYRVGVCRLPEGTRCLFACLPVADPSSMGQMILLPGLWHEDIEAYKKMTDKGERWFQANYVTIDGAPLERLTAPEYANAIHLLWRGWLHHNIDMTKLMYAIRAQVGDSTIRKADAAKIGKRFGVTGVYLDECIKDLSSRGFLQRAPKRDRPHLVKLTTKAIEGF